MKPYRFIEDQTFQHVLAKPNDFLFEELMEVKYCDNLSNQQHVEETYYDNLSKEEPAEAIHYGKPFQSSMKDLVIDNLTERKSDNDLFELKIVHLGDNDVNKEID